ncbi:DUF5709 domain-containing protein [Streptomyces bambusae]|uniref:DUF5709 domain-containing protein n=1 Tax=Streptomyces bambusae TaxID=1550616 RepID=UPI001CFCD22C|nr:DUF5709 domain-containing protein [Streptomyces bambusae]MCB5164501.1 DUF5709 domain-containing protein [Streptomyces bambusae]
MSESEARGDDVYQPAEEAEPGELQPDMANALGEPDLDQTLDTGYAPPSRPRAVARHGTTAGEQYAGETLDQRLAQEEPEPAGGDAYRGSEAVPGEDLPAADGHGGDGREEDMSGDPHGDASTAGRERSGRMTSAGEGPPDRHIAVLARDAGVDGGAASAEEAAVHVIEEAPGERP